MNTAVLEVRVGKNNHRRLVENLFEELCSRPTLTGEEAMLLIVNTCGGSRIRVPDHDDLYIASRNRAIRRQWNKGGISRTALRIEWKLSMPQLCRILKEEE